MQAARPNAARGAPWAGGLRLPLSEYVQLHAGWRRRTASQTSGGPSGTVAHKLKREKRASRTVTAGTACNNFAQRENKFTNCMHTKLTQSPESLNDTVVNLIDSQFEFKKFRRRYAPATFEY